MWKKWTLLIASLLFSLAIAEILVAVSGVAPEVGMISVGRFRYSPNPAIGYEPVPNFEYEGSDLMFYEFRGKTNSLGFRDREHSPAKPDGVYRIAVLGDSVTMGLQIQNREDLFPEVLQRELETAGHRIEVLNFGVSGYNTQQEVAIFLEKGLEYRPDLVLVQYSLNDTGAMNGGIIQHLRDAEQASAGASRSLAHPLLSRSALYRLIYFRLLSGHVDRKRMERDLALEVLEDDTVAESLALLARTSESRGFDVLVVVFPEFRKYTDELAAQHDRVADLSEQNGFHHLDLRGSFAVCYRTHGSTIALNYMHPSPSGHRCAGEAIAEYLLASPLIP
jgi:lysophospholipase L1-like esterase